MKPWLKQTGKVLRYCADCIVLLACWGLWLVLGALLAAQLAVIITKEFAVPEFALRSIEQRFTAAGVTAHFGRATFDVRGRILLENVRLSLPEFAEPVVDLRALYIELDPWLMLSGRIEPHGVRATGVNLFVPAMLAPSGRSEEILSELDFTATPGDTPFRVEYASGRIAGVTLALHGGVYLPRRAAASRMVTGSLLEAFAGNYAALSRQLIRVRERLAAFDAPFLDLTLEPSAAAGAIARIDLTARGVSYPSFHDLTATELRATTSLPLLGESPALTPLRATVAEVRLAGGRARDVRVWMQGALNLAQYFYEPRAVEVSASELAARGFTLDTASARIEPVRLPLINAEIVARCLGSALAVTGQADFTDRSATLHAVGALSPQLLEPIGALLRRDVRRFVDFGEPVELDVDAAFSRGWKFERLAGHVAARKIDAYRVPMDSVRGNIEFDGRHFLAQHAVARLGENHARGSFAQDLKSREFRFLLEGRLRPLEIGGWFRNWWPDFFSHFEFPVAPPEASVDVAGRWWAAHETTVFVFGESNGPVIRGAKFDYARTLMFIRPNFFDGLELYGTRGVGDIRGTFTRTLDLASRDWKELTFAFDSTIEVEAGARLLGPTLGRHLEPYTFERPPRVNVSGHFEGPAASEGEHQNLHIAAEGAGAFTAFGFPGENLSFDATLRDDDLTLENISADVAGGRVGGRVRVWGEGAERRAGFDLSVSGATLGRAVTTVSQYLALRRGKGEVPPDRLLPGKNSARLDLAISAEGRADDPLSYRGSGNASVAGPELGEVRLLGLLSELLNFTALRFTHAQSDFKVEGPTITFRSVNITGPNSAIQAHGNYSLPRSELDFNARVYPFQESTSILQSVVGLMLTPLSAVLEVRLTGALDEPKWAFVIGPTNLIRSLAEPSTSPGTPASPPVSTPEATNGGSVEAKTR